MSLVIVALTYERAPLDRKHSLGLAKRSKCLSFKQETRCVLLGSLTSGGCGQEEEEGWGQVRVGLRPNRVGQRREGVWERRRSE